MISLPFPLCLLLLIPQLDRSEYHSPGLLQPQALQLLVVARLGLELESLLDRLVALGDIDHQDNGAFDAPLVDERGAA